MPRHLNSARSRRSSHASCPVNSLISACFLQVCFVCAVRSAIKCPYSTLPNGQRSWWAEERELHGQELLGHGNARRERKRMCSIFLKAQAPSEPSQQHCSAAGIQADLARFSFKALPEADTHSVAGSSVWGTEHTPTKGYLFRGSQQARRSEVSARLPGECA